jgi:hypothetical protein
MHNQFESGLQCYEEIGSTMLVLLGSTKSSNATSTMPGSRFTINLTQERIFSNVKTPGRKGVQLPKQAVSGSAQKNE